MTDGDDLIEREREEVLPLISAETSNKVIAMQLLLSPKTVTKHVATEGLIKSTCHAAALRLRAPQRLAMAAALYEIASLRGFARSSFNDAIPARAHPQLHALARTERPGRGHLQSRHGALG